MITHTHALTPDRWRDNDAGVFFSVRFGGGGSTPPPPQIKARGEGEEDVGMDSCDEGVGGGLLTCVELEEVARRWCEMAAEMKDVDKRDDPWEDR